MIPPTSKTHTGSSSGRNESSGYIDTQAALPIADLSIATETVSDGSGSSIEEESDVDRDAELKDEGSPGGSELDHPRRLEEFSHLDERRDFEGGEEDSDQSDWAVDDEDWELADGGEWKGSCRRPKCLAETIRFYKAVQSFAPATRCAAAPSRPFKFTPSASPSGQSSSAGS